MHESFMLIILVNQKMCQQRKTIYQSYTSDIVVARKKGTEETRKDNTYTLNEKDSAFDSSNLLVINYL